MKIDDDLNYTVLSNNINRKFLMQFSEYPIIDELKFSELKNKIEFHTSKRIVFNNSLYLLRDYEKEEIFDLLKKQNIKYINITNDIEETIYCDYILVYDNNNLVIEGKKETILKEEKLLKKLGYGLPFVVDLSTQLNYYGVFTKIYYEMDDLVGDLWN